MNRSETIENKYQFQISSRKEIPVPNTFLFEIKIPFLSNRESQGEKLGGKVY